MSVERQEDRRSCAPIALFAYDRAEHLRHCVEALQANDMASSSDLFVFSDAPRDARQEEKVSLVREYIRTIRGFKTINVIEQPTNLGLATSVISGVSKLTDEFGKVIVVEDDLVVSPFFLSFMNDALEFYADEDRVAGVHGYMFPVGEHLPETFFLRDPGCWGWGTWKRAWDLFESNGRLLKAELERRGFRYAFDYDGEYDYSGMLDEQIAGRNSSWAVRWHASVFLADRLILHPGRSLVRNSGQDGSGTHGGATDRFEVRLTHTPVRVGGVPIEENGPARAAMVKYLHSIRGTGFSAFRAKVRSRLDRFISRKRSHR